MADFSKLTSTNDSYINKVYKLINAVKTDTIAGDSTPTYQFTQAQVDELRGFAYDENKARFLSSVGQFQTPDEAYKTQLLKIAPRMLGDRYDIGAPVPQGQGPQMSPTYGYGTLQDPTIYTQTNIPVMFGPTEASAVYSNGGLPADIVNKKTRAMSVAGTSFRSVDTKFWTADKIDQLEEAAFETGFTDKGASDGICDAFLFGGSVCYPIFKNDGPTSLLKDLNKMSLEKGCIDRWVETDRWNVVIVPSFIVTAADYLHPKSLLIPMSNTEVSTSRICMIRPKALPYWSVLYNLGWCPSDLNGWIRAYYAYEITQMSVPVMAQQMSLLLYRMPLDGLNATIGPTNVEKLMDINREEMAKWSALKPQAVNMVGEVEVVNRTYSGFDLFVGATKSELASQCGIPEPSLWHTPNKGFSDNTNESLLKQSETLKLAQQNVERCMLPARDALVAHVFGTDSQEWEQRRKLRLVFDKPIISTEKDLAEVGARFAASVNSFVQAGVSPDVAIELSKPFFPSIRVTDEMIKMAKQSYEKVQAMGLKAGQMAPGSGAMGGSGAKKTQAPNTGKGTKA